MSTSEVKLKERVKNTSDGSGLLLCPICNRPSVWPELKPGDTKTRMYTSPMRRIKNWKYDALVHQCCIHKIIEEEKNVQKA